MRLIDANDVKRRGDCYLPDVRKTIAYILSHTKTVKDAVVIVRCHECKHNPKKKLVGCPMAHLNEQQRPEDAFCWKGER